MTAMKVSFFCESVEDPIPNGRSYRERYRRFISETSEHLGTEVSFVEGSLRDSAPPRGFILFVGADVEVALHRCVPELRDGLAARLVPLAVSRPKIFERYLEPLSLAGAIDSMSRSEWENTAPLTMGTRGLYGRKDVRSQIGASCLLFESERYCYFQSNTHQGLPHLVVDYLKALAPLVDCA
jgi:hypothetical protein